MLRRKTPQQIVTALSLLWAARFPVVESHDAVEPQSRSFGRRSMAAVARWSAAVRFALRRFAILTFRFLRALRQIRAHRRHRIRGCRQQVTVADEE